MALLAILLSTATMAHGQGSESFDNASLTASYAAGSFTGDAGFTWTYGRSRNEGDYPIDGNGILFQRASDSYLEAVIPGGVGTFSFQYRKAFTGNSARNLELIVNGTQVATTGNFGAFSGADSTVYTLTHDVNTAGNVTIRIKLTGSATTGRQVTLDNLSWSEYPPAATDQPPSLGSLDITGIGSTTATFESEVTADGGQPVTARGFVYSLTSVNSDPLIGGSGVTQVSSGTGTGSFDESVSGLTVGAEYSVKAYATNSEDTTYTAVQTFSTFPALTAFFDPYEQNFSGFNSAATIPAGWEVTNDTYADNWGSGTGAGLRGNANVLGFQHTAATGLFGITLTLVNETGSTIENLFVEYLGMVERTGVGRSPEWTVEVDGSVVPALFYSTSSGVNELKSTTVTGLSIADGASFTITWTSDRGEPDGASKQIGISDVHVEAVSAMAPPTVTTAVPSGIGQTSATVGGDVTSDGGASISERGVAYNTTGTPTTGDDTLVFSGTTGTFSGELSGLTPGQTYFLRAYAINSEGTAYGDEEEFTTDCFGAPTGLSATGVSFEEFTAEWNAVTGATGYRLDVSTNPDFGEVGAREDILDEGLDESGAPVGWSENDISWESADGGYARFDSVDSWLETPVLDLSGYQNVELSFRVAKWGTGGDGPITVQVSLDGGSTWGQTFDSPTPISSAYSNSGPTAIFPLSDQVVFRFHRADSASRKRFQDVLLTGEPVTPDFVPGFEDRAVAGTSQLVDGLEENVEYFFRVRAESSLCLSGNSDVESVTTPERPIPRISIDSLVHDETAYLAFGRVVTNYMFVYANEETLFAFDGSQGLDRVFEVTDAWLANLSEANDLQVHFGSWDPDHGLNRSANPPGGQEHLYTRMTVENWFTDNYSGFDASRSSPDPVTSIAAATNVWRFTSPVAGATINDMMVDSNRISATIVNTVGGTRANQRFGWLNVIDDDTEPPRIGPTPLTVMLGDTPLPTDEQSVLVAGWNFNDADARTAVSHGRGLFSENLGNALGSFGGSSVNLVSGDAAGSDISVATVDNIGRYIQFEIDMTGLRDLIVTFAAQRSATGYDHNVVSYSVNGGSFSTLQSDWSPGTTYGLHTFDLSGEPDVDGAATVVFRIEFGVNTASGGGNNRFDNFQFNATRTVHQITDAQLATVGAANPLRLSFNVYDVDSGIYRGVTDNGVNMRISVAGIAADNTANYVEALSSAQTRSSESISVWEFENSFTPEEIGDLFEARYLPVTASVSDRDNDRPGDNLWLMDALFGVIEVIDDDDDPPEIRTVNFPNADPRPFMVLTNGAAYPSGSVIRGAQQRRRGQDENTVFKVSDFDLINSGTIGLQFAIGAVDLGSGIARGAAGTTNAVMSFSIGDVLEGDVFIPAFNAGLSTASADAGQITTNVWTFPNGFFTVEMVNALLAAGPQPVLVTIPDTDNDRPDDVAVLYSTQVGILHVIDDDIRGPIIASAQVAGAIDGSDIFFTAFESSEGWPVQISERPHTWTNVVGGYEWIGRGAIRSSIQIPVWSGVRRTALVTSDYPDPWLQLPPLNNPGILTLYAGRFGNEEDDITIRVEHWDGDSWISMGEHVVQNVNPTYELYVWDLDLEGEDVLLRVTRGATGHNQLYIEDLSVIPRSGWISTNELTLIWTEAVDDHHDVDEYRLVVPGFDTTVPAATNDGIRVEATVTNFVVDITGQQGQLTGYLFAIDDDNDRPDDRAMGNIFRVIARVDTNPPIAISGLDVVEDPTIDDSSEVRLEWETPGGSEAEAAGWRQSDSEPLSPWRSYRIYYTSEARDPTQNDPFADVTTYAALGGYETETVVLSDFAFGTTYRMAIAGEDEAGNIGPLSDSVTYQFANFVVTQGVAVAMSESRIYWQAADDREYDLIFADANNYSTNLNSEWDLVGRAVANAITDSSVDLNGYAMRFYRASPARRWESTPQIMGGEGGSGSGNGAGNRRIASEEVYVARPIRVVRGQNLISFPGIPDKLTVARVFQGAAHLPKGGTSTDSTRISWFERAQGTNVSALIWLDQSGHWKDGFTDEIVDDMEIDLRDGMVLEIPQSAEEAEYVFLFVGRVPSSEVASHAQEQVIAPDGANNLVSARLPRFMHPRDLNLVSTDEEGVARYGMRAGLGISVEYAGIGKRADAVWALNRDLQRPSGTMYYYDGSLGSYPLPGWHHPTGAAHSGNQVTGTPFGPDDAIVIRTFGSEDEWIWTNSIPYAAPTRFLD